MMQLNLKQALVGVLIFTIVEVITLGLWFSGSTPPVQFSTIGKVALVAGLYIEHLVSVIVGFNVSTGRAWYSWPF